eukprot:TRINITY_DN11628_c0_g1_i1.p1 TRINITY_DN11628_c0_g1~~TRINITY_DN11628_c0_g1_i1.p1  ORF type:complete len:315 (+),score=52.87 TRINITY_DN11628_c0_g1_i1:32-976(+)
MIPILWVVFIMLVLASLMIDIGFFGDNLGTDIKQALYFSALWIAIALGFNVCLYWSYGSDAAMEFLTSYLLEKGLSIDNVFVFYILFEQFEIPFRNQRRILKWGIIGALFMRGIFISTGLELLKRFHFLIWVFGAFLFFTGAKLMNEFTKPAEDETLDDSIYINYVKKCIPYIDDVNNDNFFVFNESKNRYFPTTLFITLVCIEVMDAVFALDSIPAILSITQDPLVVYTSNIFAILGLRALYFAISGMVKEFHYMKFGLALILCFVGVKMLVANWIKIPLPLALFFIGFTIIGSVVYSIYQKDPDTMIGENIV